MAAGRITHRTHQRRRTAVALIVLAALGPAAVEQAASQSQFQFTAAVLGTLPGGFASEATAINDSGQVVGYDWTGSAYHSFIWQTGVMTDLGTLGCCTQAFGINASGQVVGGSSGRAFIWQNGVMTDLGTPGGFSTASGINDAGQVVGTFFPPGFVSVQGNGHAFLWQNGVTIDLGTLGGLESRAAGDQRFRAGGWRGDDCERRCSRLSLAERRDDRSRHARRSLEHGVGHQ